MIEGVTSPDGFGGSQAELYLLLTDFGESQIVHAAAVDRGSILELGCGTGRMTRALLELGHAVTAVDQDAEMLGHVPEGAEAVLSDIESLNLGHQYSVVLLASNLINDPEVAVRSRLLATCRRHVSPDGVVILQRYQPDLLGWEPSDWVNRGPVAVRISHFQRRGDRFSATIEYRHEDREWTHRFSAAILDDESVEAELAHADLRFDRALDPERTWLLARP